MASNDRKKEEPKKSLLARKRLQAETQEPQPTPQPEQSETAEDSDWLLESLLEFQRQSVATDEPVVSMERFKQDMLNRKRLVESWGGVWKG